MKNKILKAIAGLLVAALAVTAVPAMPQAAASGDKGPWKDDYLVEIGSEEEDNFKCIASANSDFVQNVQGASYDAKTNTLTLKNYNGDKDTLRIFRMGDDFTINVEGNNSLKNIITNPYDVFCDWGGSIRISGNGTLDINKKNGEFVSVSLNRMPGSTKKLSFVVDGTVTLNIGMHVYDEGMGDAVYAAHHGELEVSIPGSDITFDTWLGDSYEKLYKGDEAELTLITPNDPDVKGTYAVSDDNEWALRIIDTDAGKFAKYAWTDEESEWINVAWAEKTDEKVNVKIINKDYFSVLEKDGEKYYFVWGENGFEIYSAVDAGLDAPVMVLTETIANWDGAELEAKGYSAVISEDSHDSVYHHPISVKAIDKGAISKLKAGKKSATVVAKSVKGAAGYEVRYATAKNMKNAKTVSSKKAKIKLKKLNSKKTYYVQIRAIKRTSSGQIAYGEWSEAKSVVVK